MLSRVVPDAISHPAHMTCTEVNHDQVNQDPTKKSADTPSRRSQSLPGTSPWARFSALRRRQGAHDGSPDALEPHETV